MKKTGGYLEILSIKYEQILLVRLTQNLQHAINHYLKRHRNIFSEKNTRLLHENEKHLGNEMKFNCVRDTEMKVFE